MSRPKLLDLFCGAGGCSVGYHRAGFDVTGVDIAPQKRYPYDFVCADALTFPLDGFDAIHASPPCQFRSAVTAWRGSRENHPDLLTPTLALLTRVRVPWVVENVPEAGLRADYQLCGTQFGLPIRRHRDFQQGNWSDYELRGPCRCYQVKVLPFGHKNERVYADAMGCEWMSIREARQAIPPAYTEMIGAALRKHF